MARLHIASKQHYSCILCGRCCRRFHVRIDNEECQRLQQLPWGDATHPTDFTHTIQNNLYFKRRKDGGCVFLNDQGTCSIHEKFGFDVKALTCRGYPMNIVSTFPGELSVLARMDCPAVLQDHGTPLTEQRKDIEQLISEMSFGKPFTPEQCCGLTRQTIEKIRDNIAQIVENHDVPLYRRICTALAFLDACQKLGAVFLNDSKTMKDVWKTLLSNAENATAKHPAKGIPPFFRIVFRSWIAAYCRRDEEVLDRSLAGRLKRFIQNLRFIFNRGSWHDLGFEHPDFPFRDANLFGHADKPSPPSPDTSCWIPYQRFLQARLECFQFFGASYYDTDFFTGLKALLKTYAHVLASAHYHAAANHRDTICHDDVFYAVLSVDHAHGRSPALSLSLGRFNENLFSSPRFENLLADLGWQ